MINFLTGRELDRVCVSGLKSLCHYSLEKELTKRGLNVIGTGGFSVVVDHPDEPDKIIRVSSQDDGWVSYVTRAQSAPHAPRVFGLCFDGGRWVAISEKLTPCSFDRLDVAQRAAVKAMLTAQETNSMNSEERSALSKYQSLNSFITEHLKAEGVELDTGLTNMMMRGDVPVYNDPYKKMLPGDESHLHSTWRKAC